MPLQTAVFQITVWDLRHFNDCEKTTARKPLRKTGFLILARNSATEPMESALLANQALGRQFRRGIFVKQGLLGRRIGLGHRMGLGVN
jgi:hypothetical protein